MTFIIDSIPTNAVPPTDVKDGYVRLSIAYNKKGVDTQDIYDIQTRQAQLGIFLDGGKTFISFSGKNVRIDATYTHTIRLVPLQNALHDNIAVSANKPWQNTGIFLKKGSEYRVKYTSGTWIRSGDTGPSDAAGQPVNPPHNLICHCGEPLEGYSTQALIGKIGDNPDRPPLSIGDDFSGIAYDNDFLYLRMNLGDQFLPHSSGTIMLSIETKNMI